MPEIAIDKCYIHGDYFAFNPDTVVSVLIDPQTGRPPDVDAQERHVTPEPGSVERSVKRPVCDDCTALVNARLRARGYPEVQYARDREEGSR